MAGLTEILAKRIGELEEELDELPRGANTSSCSKHTIQEDIFDKENKSIRNTNRRQADCWIQMKDDKRELAEDNEALKAEFNDVKRLVEAYREEFGRDSVKHMIQKNDMARLIEGKEEDIASMIPHIREVLHALDKFKDASQSAKLAAKKLKSWIESKTGDA